MPAPVPSASAATITLFEADAERIRGDDPQPSAVSRSVYLGVPSSARATGHPGYAPPPSVSTLGEAAAGLNH